MKFRMTPRFDSSGNPRVKQGRKFALATLLALLAGCAFPGAPQPGSPQAQANEQTAAACRQRADALYNIRHRDAIYAPASQVNTPFSANYQPGVPDRGLSDLYERDSMVSDCERNTGSEGDRTPDDAALPPVNAPVARP
jgi:hypothetical protein